MEDKNNFTQRIKLNNTFVNTWTPVHLLNKKAVVIIKNNWRLQTLLEATDYMPWTIIIIF